MNKQAVDIIKSCIKGDRKAQKMLYETHKVYLYGVCMRYTRSKAEAEDMLLEGFYRILKDLKQYTKTANLKAWMRRVMINSCLMHIRKHRKIQFSELNESHIESRSPTDMSLLNSDRATAIIALIRELPLSHQTVFNLKAIDGYSFKEISNMLDTNEATLRSHFLRARTKLQQLLQNEYQKT